MPGPASRDDRIRQGHIRLFFLIAGLSRVLDLRGTHTEDAGILGLPQLPEEPVPVIVDVSVDGRPRAHAVRGYVSKIRGVAFRRNRQNVDLQLLHDPGPDQCTVACATGEERTGHHPCVTCSVAGITIRLCC
jgi:hypothetical protein